MSDRLNVLCLDIEGGYGGSSRSLFETISAMPRREAKIEVWCRKIGPVQARYDAIDVACRVLPEMPHISSLPRLTRNIAAYGRFTLRWPGTAAFRQTLTERLTSADVVHLNHEGLFLLAAWLTRHTDTPVVAHVRTRIPSTFFSRWQYRILGKAAKKMVFITENEQENVEKLTGKTVDGQVVYNCIARPDSSIAADPGLVSDQRFKIAVLSNYSYMRGLDRLVDVAVELKSMQEDNFLFVMAGDMRLGGTLPGVLGRIARRGGTLSDYADARGVGSMFRFLGHVSTPEVVLSACDVLAKPTREANPWGRDILEGLAHGKPVFSVGTYDRFLENKVTGKLFPRFEAVEWAKELVNLSRGPTQYGEMSNAARERIALYCDPKTQAQALLKVWRDVAAGKK